MQDLENRLIKRYKHLKKWIKRDNIEAFRLYNHDIPEYPLIIDIYADYAVISIKLSHYFDESAEQQLAKDLTVLLKKVLDIKPGHIYFKFRQKQAGSWQYQKISRTKSEIIITENKLKYLINLTDYLDTGLFLDHRDTRKTIQKMSNEALVLNLFCYTGSFSVAAASGNADRVISIDMSNTYLDWAKKNFELNGINENEHTFLRTDVLEYLKAQSGAYQRFDIIILDPPSFSNSKRMKTSFDIKRDHEELVSNCMNILTKDGVLLFSTNKKGFKLSDTIKNRNKVKDISHQSTPEDFKKTLPHQAFFIRHL